MSDTPPPILYKYMSSKRISFFATPQLRFSPPSDFNDIFDCHIRTKGLVGPEFLIKQAKTQSQREFDKIFDEELIKMGFRRVAIRKLTPGQRAELKKQFEPMFEKFLEQVGTMSATEENRERLSQSVQNALNQARVGVLCLTPDNVNTVMWGVYGTGPEGQGNMGFAVGFDTRNAFFNRKLTPEDALRHIRPVSYPENPPERYLSDYVEENLSEQGALFEILYTKDKKWEAEKEWRMAITVPEDSESKVFGLEDVPIDVIKEVFLGVRADSDLENAASEFCKQHGIPLFRMKTTVDRELKPEPIPLNR